MSYEKRLKVDQSDLRTQCRVGCGADIVIENVLPYLLPSAEREVSGSDGDEGSNEEGDSSDMEGYSSEEEP